MHIKPWNPGNIPSKEWLVKKLSLEQNLVLTKLQVLCAGSGVPLPGAGRDWPCVEVAGENTSPTVEGGCQRGWVLWDGYWRDKRDWELAAGGTRGCEPAVGETKESEGQALERP